MSADTDVVNSLLDVSGAAYGDIRDLLGKDEFLSKIAARQGTNPWAGRSLSAVKRKIIRAGLEYV